MTCMLMLYYSFINLLPACSLLYRSSYQSNISFPTIHEPRFLQLSVFAYIFRKWNLFKTCLKNSVNEKSFLKPSSWIPSDNFVISLLIKNREHLLISFSHITEQKAFFSSKFVRSFEMWASPMVYRMPLLIFPHIM